MKRYPGQNVRACGSDERRDMTGGPHSALRGPGAPIIGALSRTSARLLLGHDVDAEIEIE
jgi:hypothetical protein